MSFSRESKIPGELVRDHLSTLIQERSFINIDHKTPSIKNLISKQELPSYPENPKDPEYSVNTAIYDSYCDEKDRKYQHLQSDLSKHCSSTYTYKTNAVEEQELHDPEDIRQKWNQNIKQKKYKPESKQPRGKIRSFFGDNWRPVFPKCSFNELGTNDDAKTNNSDPGDA